MKKTILLIAVFLLLKLLILGSFYSYGQDVGVITRNNPDGSETPVAIIELGTEQVYPIEDNNEWYDDVGPRILTINNPDGSETPVATIELDTEQVYPIEEVNQEDNDWEWEDYDYYGASIGHHQTHRRLYPLINVDGGVINTGTEGVYPLINVKGGLINTGTGDFYPRVKGGAINTGKGGFMPLIR